VEVVDTRALEQLQELIGGDREQLNELVETFLVEGDEIVVDMHTAVAQSDVELLRRSAHSLKSSAQDFGASQLSTLSATLESASKNELPENADGQVSAIKDQFAAAKLELQAYLS